VFEKDGTEALPFDCASIMPQSERRETSFLAPTARLLRAAYQRGQTHAPREKERRSRMIYQTPL
jgi:hypothetical protein